MEREKKKTINCVFVCFSFVFVFVCIGREFIKAARKGNKRIPSELQEKWICKNFTQKMFARLIELLTKTCRKSGTQKW